MSVMNKGSGGLLQHRAINGRGLFWLLATAISVATINELMAHDLSHAPDVSHMISFSVRFAVPLIYLVVASSALPVLFPGRLPSWLLRNRKFIGLSFAVAMAWQGLFIFLMSRFQRDYYFAEIFYLRDELEGSTGYLFLAAMVATSFRSGRKFLSLRDWKFLHRSGMYFLWAYPFSVYWWNLSYYPDPQPIDYLFYWAGFLACASRIAAWTKRRWHGTVDAQSQPGPSPARRALGTGLIVSGIVIAATGRQWQEAVTAFLLAPDWSANLVLWLPFWPFEPFLSLFVIGLGGLVLTRHSESRVAHPAGV